MATTTVPIPTRLLVLGMAREDGTIRAEELYPVAEACGQSPEQVRSCLRRLVSQGMFARTGSGRDAVFTATAGGAASLDDWLARTRRALTQDAAGRGWDGQWRLVGFAVPERRRPARDAMRDRLLRLGGAPVQGGLYVSPHDWDDDVRAEAKHLELSEHLTLAATRDLDVGGVREPRHLAATLWPLDEVADRYGHFVAQHQDVPATLSDIRRRKGRLADTSFLPIALSMAVAYDACASIDPYLPPELLPRPWPGRTARDILVRSRRLALQLREQSRRPALFALFDELLDEIS